MPPVYVSQAGAIVGTRSGRLVVTLSDQLLLDVPIEHVEGLTVLGRGVQVTTAVLTTLASRGIEVAFLSRSGRFLGTFSGAPGAAVRARIAQVGWAADPDRVLTFARLVVSSKIANQARWLEARLGAPTNALERAVREASRAPSVEALRGIEGSAARMVFQEIAGRLPTAFGFQGRAYHPPPDPANALLSLGYTLVLNEVIGATHTVGLDPYPGMLHVSDPSRPGFALDVIEELRPVVDDLVVRLLTSAVLTPADFTRAAGGYRLTPDGRARFLLAYEQQLSGRIRHPLAHGRVSVRQAITLQLRAYVRLFTGEAATVAPLALIDLWSGA